MSTEADTFTARRCCSSDSVVSLVLVAPLAASRIGVAARLAIVISIDERPRAVFLWGLKRSGNHLLANWLYANLGGAAKHDLPAEGLHRQLTEGFCDPGASVAFVNNCGWLHSRKFDLGPVDAADFEKAMERHAVTIFGIEDCALRCATRVPTGEGITPVLIMRDPLNNIASRLEGRKAKPDVFRTDEAYIELLAAYCEELLGRSSWLGDKVVVSFNDFVASRSYRDALADRLGIENRDVVSEAVDFGGGSSFAGDQGASSLSSLMTRYQQHPIPAPLLAKLVGHDAVREACSAVFGYDLAAVVQDA